METVKEILPSVLAHLPEPSSDKSESPSSPAPARPSVSLPLATKWQQAHLRMEAVSPGIQMLADRVETWCKAVRKNDRTSRCLIATGIFGCGKTKMLRAARRYVQAIYMDVWPEFWKHPLNVQSIEFPRFAAEVEKGNQDWFDDVCAADVVFIDDIGAEEDRFRSGGATRVLGDLLGGLEHKFTFITTNIEPSGWRARWDGRVEDRLLRRNSTICNLWEPALNTRSFSEAQIGL